MRKGLISVVLLLCVNVCLSVAADETANKAQVKPYWLKTNYSGNWQGKTGFVGQSNKWHDQGSASQVQSIEEACKEASRRVAEFFSVRVQSSVKSQLNVAGEQYLARFEDSANIESDITLEGINRSDTYTESFAEGYLISFCLIELTTTQINQTKARLQAEQQALDNLIAQTVEQIVNNQFERAQLSIAQLKNKQASEELVKDLTGLLEEQQKKALRVDLTFSRLDYGIGDYLSFTIASNQNAYIYVFLEGGKSTKLIFPSPSSNANLLIKSEPLQYPLKVQVREGEAFRFPKSQTSEYLLRVIARTEQQAIHFLHSSFNGYSVANDYSYQQYISECRLAATCKEMLHKVKVESASKQLLVASYNVKVNGQYSKAQRAQLRNVLKQQRIEFTKTGKDLLVEAQIDSAFSDRLKAQMYIITARLYELEKSGERNLLSRSKVTGLMDNKKLPILLEKLYQKLLKKAQ